MLIGVLLVIACCALLYYMLTIGTRIKIGAIVIMLACAGFVFFILFDGIRGLMSRDKAGLILSPGGINFMGRPNARKIGKIAWKDIKSLSVGRAYGSTFVCLKLQNPDKYIQNISPQLQQNIISRGIFITNEELSIDFEEMKNLIERYYNQYK